MVLFSLVEKEVRVWAKADFASGVRSRVFPPAGALRAVLLQSPWGNARKVM